MAQGFDAGAIIAKLELQKQQWNASIEGVKKDMSGIGKEVETTSNKMSADWAAMAKKTALAITAVTGVLFALVKKTSDYGDELWKTSQKTGIAVETLSGFKLAADKSDLSLRSLATGLARMSRTVSEAQSGMKEYQDILQRAGLKATDATGKMRSMDDMLYDLSDKFKSMPDGVEKTALAMDIFGKAGMEMIPLLNLGSEGLKREREEAERLGQVISGPTAQACEKFNDELTTLKKALLGVTLTIGKELMPVFQGIVENVVKIIVSIRPFILIVWEARDAIIALGIAIESYFVGKTIQSAIAGVGNFGAMIAKISVTARAALVSFKLLATGMAGSIAVFTALAFAGKKLNDAFLSLQATHDAGIRAEYAHAEIQKKSIDRFRETAAAVGMTGEKIRELSSKYKDIEDPAIKHEKMLRELIRLYPEATKFLRDKSKAHGEAADSYKNEEQQQTVDLAAEAAKRESIIEKQFDKFEKEAKDYFKKILTYSGQEVKGEIIDWRERTVNVQQMSQKMKTYFTDAMGDMGIKFKTLTGKIKDETKKTTVTFGDYLQIMQQGFSQFFTAFSSLSEARFKNEMSQLDTEYEKKKQAIEDSLLSEEEKTIKLKELNEGYATDKKALEIRQAEATKKSNTYQALINMFTAITASWKLGWPLGVFAAAFAAIACKIQIAAIKATPLPAMAQGGLLTQATPVIAGEAGPEAFVPLPELKEMLGVGRTGRNQQATNINFSIQAWDSKDVTRVVNEKVVPFLKKAMRRESFTVPAMAVR